MDEPFSALDPLTRSQLQEELADLQAKVQKTIVFVTHDMDEAVKIADRICLIHEGAIVQYDTVEEIMKNPANDYVAGFIGRNRIWSSPQAIRAEDIMICDPVCVHGEATVLRCTEKMRNSKVDSLMIVDKRGSLAGIVMAKTLQSAADKKQPVSQIMLRQFEAVAPDANLLEILDIVNAGSLSSIPVVDGGKDFTEQDILGNMLTLLLENNTDLKVEYKHEMASNVVFAAIQSGDIDFILITPGLFTETILAIRQ